MIKQNQQFLNAVLVLFPGPDSEVVKTSAIEALNEYIILVNALGYDVTRSGIFRALHQGGVQNVIINEPASDIVLAKNRYAQCTATSISVTEFRDV